jgi:hypothetical protein
MEILKSLPQSQISRPRSLNHLSQLHLTTLCRNRETFRITPCRSPKSLRQGLTNPGSKRCLIPGFKSIHPYETKGDFGLPKPPIQSRSESKFGGLQL